MVALAERTSGEKVFVAHRATGVRVIPAGWLEAWRPSGFREATPSEVMEWYEERGSEPPSEVLRALAAIAVLAAAAAEQGDAEGMGAIRLPG